MILALILSLSRLTDYHDACDKLIHNSCWLDYDYKSSKPLDENIDTDIAIVGGGITGISAAYHLSNSTSDFVMLEGKSIASGSTGHGAGSLVAGLGLDLWQHIKYFGRRDGFLIYSATIDIIREMEALIKKDRLECGLEKSHGYYVVWEESQENMLHKEFKAVKDYGIKAKLIHKEKIKDELKINPRFTECLKYEYMSRVFDPAKFSRGLARDIKKKGIRIYENTNVIKIKKTKSHFKIETKNGTVTSKKLLLTTGSYLIKEAEIEDKRYSKEPDHAIVTKPIPKSILKEFKLDKPKLIWDTRIRYAFIRTMKDRILITGGERTINGLYEQLFHFFPGLPDVGVDYSWTCHEIWSEDARPSIGEDPKLKGMYYSMGYTWHGMTLGFLGGKLLSELCTNTVSSKSRHLLRLFKPKHEIKLV